MENYKNMNLLLPENEYIDPNPDIHVLFLEYNQLFFESRLSGCEVKWSKRMTLCAGICSFHQASGYCSIRLSEPLLKYRPRSDLVNTLLHEMIHAFLFVTQNKRDRDDHGESFCRHMNRINTLGGSSITIYHSFHNEVASYRTHWWKCNGPCQNQPPYFGIVKRAVNRPPGHYDRWWLSHQSTCGGLYEKIREPEEYTKRQQAKKGKKKQKGKHIMTYFSGKGETSLKVLESESKRPLKEEDSINRIQQQEYIYVSSSSSEDDNIERDKKKQNEMECITIDVDRQQSNEKEIIDLS